MLEEIRNLRKSLHVLDRASLVQILDETFEILEKMEKRLQTLEQANEETD